jgi:Arc/MetJ family transcription regulator
VKFSGLQALAPARLVESAKNFSNPICALARIGLARSRKTLTNLEPSASEIQIGNLALHIDINQIMVYILEENYTLEEVMRTNIDLDDTLVKKAMEISGMNTKRAAINLILNEYVRKNNQKNILKYRGKKIWEGDLEQMRENR